MDSKKGKKNINQIFINGLEIDIQSPSSIQYFYEYDEFETEGIIGLDYLSKEFRKDIQEEIRLFLFAVNPCWLKDSRIVRSKKYWDELQNHNLLKRIVDLEHQSMFIDGGLIRYGLLCTFSILHLSLLIQYSLENRNCGLFILNNINSNFEEITRSLFESCIYKSNNKLSSIINWDGYIKAINANNGIALIAQGWFDYGAIYLNVIKK